MRSHLEPEAFEVLDLVLANLPVTFERMRTANNHLQMSYSLTTTGKIMLFIHIYIYMCVCNVCVWKLFAGSRG